MTWTKYRRTNIAEMRPYVPGEDLTGVSVSEADKALSAPDFNEGMIARNPANHADRWYIARDYFDANFEPLDLADRVR